MIFSLRKILPSYKKSWAQFNFTTTIVPTQGPIVQRQRPSIVPTWKSYSDYISSLSSLEAIQEEPCTMSLPLIKTIQVSESEPWVQPRTKINNTTRKRSQQIVAFMGLCRDLMDFNSAFKKMSFVLPAPYTLPRARNASKYCLYSQICFHAPDKDFHNCLLYKLNSCYAFGHP